MDRNLGCAKMIPRASEGPRELTSLPCAAKQALQGCSIEPDMTVDIMEPIGLVSVLTHGRSICAQASIVLGIGDLTQDTTFTLLILSTQ